MIVMCYPILKSCDYHMYTNILILVVQGDADIHQQLHCNIVAAFSGMVEGCVSVCMCA